MESVAGYAVGVLLVGLGIGASIGLHELGHMLPAKLFGVRVKQFMIGFGPTLVAFRRGGTEYGLKLIPLGGYVALNGMYPPPSGAAPRTGVFRRAVYAAQELSAAGEDAADGKRAFYELHPLQKIVIMLGGPVVNLLLASAIAAVILTGIGIPKPTTTVASVSECLVAAAAKNTGCTHTDPAAPAAAAGIKPGDTVAEIAGVPVRSWQQLADTIAANPGKKLPITVRRGDTLLHLTVTPAPQQRTTAPPAKTGDGAARHTPVQTVGMIGVSPVNRYEKQDLSRVPEHIGAQIGAGVTVLSGLPERLGDIWDAAFGGAKRDPNGPVSVVGVGRLAGEIAAAPDATEAAKMTGILSVLGGLNTALFVFNLVPLLPLDGGHVAGAVTEAVRNWLYRVRGKPAPAPLNTAKLLPLTYCVAALLIGISALLIYADIVAPVTFG